MFKIVDDIQDSWQISEHHGAVDQPATSQKSALSQVFVETNQVPTRLTADSQ